MAWRLGNADGNNLSSSRSSRNIPIERINIQIVSENSQSILEGGNGES